MNQQQHQQQHQQRGEKCGWLNVDDTSSGRWYRAWFALRGTYLFQYPDPSSQQASALMSLVNCSLTSVDCPPMYIFTLMDIQSRRISFAASNSPDRDEWVRMMTNNAGIANSPSMSSSAGATSASFNLTTPFGSTATTSSNNNSLGSTNSSTIMSDSSSFSPLFNTTTLSGGVSPDAFWTSSFGNVVEVAWPIFLASLQKQLGTTVPGSSVGPLAQALAGMGHDPRMVSSLYTILNVVSQNALTTRGVVTWENFRLFVATFGPLEDCMVKSFELCQCGYFHGEQSSAESEQAIRNVPGGPSKGSFLLRLRQGARQQVAFAYVDGTGRIKHSLVSIRAGTYFMEEKAGVFKTISQLVEANRGRFTKPVFSDLVTRYGPVGVLPVNVSSLSSLSFPSPFLQQGILAPPSIPAPLSNANTRTPSLLSQQPTQFSSFLPSLSKPPM